MRIAALDDDALQLDLIKQATEAMGHVCHTHLTGAELMRTLRRETFDLLIVDWHLPDTAGPEVVRWVRQNVAARVPILFVTHRQEERDIVEGLGSGADDFMVKPVRIGDDCWIGGGAIICPGVTIGPRSIIGAGAVVTRDIPADSVAVGNPARVIRTLCPDEPRDPALLS